MTKTYEDLDVKRGVMKGGMYMILMMILFTGMAIYAWQGWNRPVATHILITNLQCSNILNAPYSSVYLNTSTNQYWFNNAPNDEQITYSTDKYISNYYTTLPIQTIINISGGNNSVVYYRQCYLNIAWEK